MLSTRNLNKTFSLPFSLTDLADYLSVDRSAMMRELKLLKEDGFIKKNGKRITLVYKWDTRDSSKMSHKIVEIQRKMPKSAFFNFYLLFSSIFVRHFGTVPSVSFISSPVSMFLMVIMLLAISSSPRIITYGIFSLSAYLNFAFNFLLLK